MEVKCSDICNLVKSKVPASYLSSVITILQSGCSKDNSTYGKTECKNIKTLFDSLVKPSMTGVPKFSQFVDSLLADPCPGLLQGCSQVICDMTEDNKPCTPSNTTMSLSCEQVKALLDGFFKTEVGEAFGTKSGISNTSDLCNMLKSLVNPLDFVKKLLDHEMGTLGVTDITYYDDELEGLLSCMCPNVNFEPSSPTGAPTGFKPPSELTIDKLTTGILGGACGLALIISVIVTAVVVKNAQAKAAAIGFSVLIPVLVFVLLFVLNPKGIFRWKIGASDPWKSIPGTYKGEAKEGPVKIQAQATIGAGKKITLDSLLCLGEGCPDKMVNGVDNMLQRCEDKTAYVGELDPQGYQLTGSCPDKLLQIKTTDGSNAVRGLWIQLRGNLYMVVIQIHVTGLPIVEEIDAILEVPMYKVE